MHEAQMNDSRMNVNSLLTSTIDQYIPGMKGAKLANYVELISLVKDTEGNITGAKVMDRIANKEFTIKCKAVVNCTGIHADSVR